LSSPVVVGGSVAAHTRTCVKPVGMPGEAGRRGAEGCVALPYGHSQHAGRRWRAQRCWQSATLRPSAGRASRRRAAGHRQSARTRGRHCPARRAACTWWRAVAGCHAYITAVSGGRRQAVVSGGSITRTRVPALRQAGAHAERAIVPAALRRRRFFRRRRLSHISGGTNKTPGVEATEPEGLKVHGAGSSICKKSRMFFKRSQHEHVLNKPPKLDRTNIGRCTRSCRVQARTDPLRALAPWARQQVRCSWAHHEFFLLAGRARLRSVRAALARLLVDSGGALWPRLWGWGVGIGAVGIGESGGWGPARGGWGPARGPARFRVRAGAPGGWRRRPRAGGAGAGASCPRQAPAQGQG
jgi:hypothetical protein